MTKIGELGKSMRWKLVFIYTLLVFIATTIIGVLIMSQLESYYMESTRNNLEKTVNEGLISSLNAYETLSESKEEIQANVDAWGKTMQEEIFVVDDKFTIIASSSANSSTSAFSTLEPELIYGALSSGKPTNSYSQVVNQSTSIPVMSMAFPVGKGSGIKGVVYVRTDMSLVYDNINKSKQIFLRAMAAGLAVTVILSMFIARSITTPINDVTEKAEKMAQGDFSQEVNVKSSDEIGRLAEMFNLLRIQLNATLFEMSGEKNKIETILKNMADGLIAVDLSGNILHANPAALRMLHIEKKEEELPKFDLLLKELHEDLSLDVIVEKCREGEFTEVYETGGFTYFTRYDWLKDENGKDIGIILLIQDITQRQKLERMQMDFVANVSHELKTPLTTIKSYTETLLDGYVDDPATQGEFMRIIDGEADRMNRLVKDLLQLSRLDNNQEVLHTKEGNIISLLKSVVKSVELTAEGKNQHINCLFDPDLWLPVDMDKDRIQQVMLNILTNAIKYTPEGGRIDVDAQRQGGLAEITIADNGIGIPEGDTERVFERFFRVDKARSRAMGGTGLGLAISKEIVQAHGGTIGLTSKEGSGTRVTIQLPLSVSRGVSNIS